MALKLGSHPKVCGTSMGMFSPVNLGVVNKSNSASMFIDNCHSLCALALS